MLSRTIILKASGLKPVERLVRRSRLFRPMVKRFIAGDTIPESFEASQALLQKKIKVTLDYLGENTTSKEEANAAVATYLEMLEAVANCAASSPTSGAAPVLTSREHKIGDSLPPAEPLNLSIKLTQCGLDQGLEFCEANLVKVLARAQELKNFIRLDMESSDYTERTISTLEKLFPTYPNVGTVLQSYLYRTDEDVERLIAIGARCRLVKGAYLEPESVAIQSKQKVDEAYVKQAKRLLTAAFYPAIATQDETIIQELKQFVETEKIDKSRFEWQMLYGIRRDLQEGLIAEGYNVRVYVPFGDSWYPYFTRRLAERPANMAFIAKAMIKG